MIKVVQGDRQTCQSFVEDLKSRVGQASPEIEQTVRDVIEQVRADDFYAEENKRIFETIYSMFNGAQRIDPVPVLDMLTRMGYYDEAGGRAYLFQLMEVTPGARNVNEYVRIVRDKSLLRQLADAGSEIQQNALEAHGEASGIAELAEQRIYSIRQGREIKGLSRLSEVIADLYTELDERARSDSEIPGMSTGFHALDTALTGLNKSDLILIAARPGMGKTAFALNVALNAAKASVKNKERGDKKGTGVCVFQLEMGKEQLASRFLSSEALIESQKLKTGNLDGDDWVKIARASGVLAGLNIYVDDNPAITVAEIKAKCRRLGDELGLIVIDYLQLMHVGGRHMDNRVQEVAEMTDGKNTLIGSGGAYLSGGQAKRLAFARTLCHDKPILILDDPFSALDKNTEKQAFVNLQALAKGSIVLLISHRLYLFPEMDGVIWMENGKAVTGTHEELLKTVPEYKSLYTSQVHTTENGGAEHDAQKTSENGDL